jgi:hypothetical protein
VLNSVLVILIDICFVFIIFWIEFFFNFIPRHEVG